MTHRCDHVTQHVMMATWSRKKQELCVPDCVLLCKAAILYHSQHTAFPSPCFTAHSSSCAHPEHVAQYSGCSFTAAGAVACCLQTSIAEVLAAMIPCSRLYGYLGCQLAAANAAAALPRHAYTEWIEVYSGEKYLVSISRRPQPVQSVCHPVQAVHESNVDDSSLHSVVQDCRTMWAAHGSQVATSGKAGGKNT